MGADFSCSNCSGDLTVIAVTPPFAHYCRTPARRVFVCAGPLISYSLSSPQTSCSRSKKQTWTSSCHPSLNLSQTSQCCRRRAWRFPPPRANHTGPSRSPHWGPVQSRRVSSFHHSSRQDCERHDMAVWRTISHAYTSCCRK